MNLYIGCISPVDNDPSDIVKSLLMALRDMVNGTRAPIDTYRIIAGVNGAIGSLTCDLGPVGTSSDLIEAVKSEIGPDHVRSYGSASEFFEDIEGLEKDEDDDDREACTCKYAKAARAAERAAPTVVKIDPDEAESDLKDRLIAFQDECGCMYDETIFYLFTQ